MVVVPRAVSWAYNNKDTVKVGPAVDIPLPKCQRPKEENNTTCNNATQRQKMGLHVGVVQGPLNCCAEAEVQAENLHPEKVEEIERGKRKKDIKRVPVYMWRVVENGECSRGTRTGNCATRLYIQYMCTVHQFVCSR